MSMQHLLRDHLCLTVAYQRSMQWHCVMVCKLALHMYKFFNFGSLLAFLKFVESVNCSYFVPTLQEVIWRLLCAVACIVIDISHTALLFTTACTIQT